MRIAFAKGGQVHQFEHLGDDLRAVRLLANPEGDVLRHGQMGKQRVVLKDHADAALLRRQGEARAGNDRLRQVDFALVHRLEAGDGT